MPSPLRVVWYTDPHNVWCWGCEPAIRRLEHAYPDRVEIEVRQGGLFEDFSPIRDQWARMSGGRWKDSVRAFFEAVAAHHRMPMDADRMTESADDFASTWPACIAAKAADLQGPEVGRRYLRHLREAWCIEGQGIHRRSVQEALAARGGLDVGAFRDALETGAAEAAFQADREACHEARVTGFPTFEIRRGDDTVRIEGWQPWESFDELVRRMDPGLEPRHLEATGATVQGLFRRHGRYATREIAAILGGTDDDAEILLEQLEDQGVIVRRAVGSGLMWEAVEEIPLGSRPETEEARGRGRPSGGPP